MTSSKFQIGDIVSWVSEAGILVGKIVDIHEMPFWLNRSRHNATQDDPHYEIACLTTGRMAYHKAGALRLERSAA
ncbi:HVA1 family protein [Aristophania vespae]|uniref:HVA1 family protein n=1 Tax=Aristophania vespae TaxID=2697033 RepID=A0A6P1NCA8_9PROT|nr:DUF2945 domain-containing protein [Aristophania vespae]QHI95143.1 HVA1 family protein [Aristophania vespae]UMM64359.1 hypothetical protein DM15PD_13730 [Aristophania vespae]